MKSARRRSRELATQGLYQWLLSSAPGSEIEEQLRGAQGFDKADQEHLEAILYGVIKEADTINTELQPCLDRPLDQLSPVERAVLMAQDSQIKPADLALRSGREMSPRLEDMSIEEVEGILVRKALQRFHGNVSQAAEALGLSRGALYRRMERYGL